MSYEQFEVIASDGVSLRVERFDAQDVSRGVVLFAAPTGIEANAYSGLYERLNAAGCTVFFCEARYAVRASGSASPPDLSLMRHGLDIFEIWQQVVAAPVTLLGHCMGALSAAAALRIFSQQHQGHNVKHYFLVNGVYCLDAGVTEYEKSLHNLVVRYRARPKMLEIIYPTVRNSLASYAENAAHLPYFRPVDSVEHFVRYVQVLSGLYASYQTLFVGEAVEARGHLIFSDKDTLLSERQSVLAQQVFVNATLHRYADSGHYLPCEVGDVGMSTLVEAITAAASVDTVRPALAWG